MSPIQRLPIELWSMIVEKVESRDDLCNLSRSTRFLQYEAERWLYRRISCPTLEEGIQVLCHSIDERRVTYVRELTMGSEENSTEANTEALLRLRKTVWKMRGLEKMKLYENYPILLEGLEDVFPHLLHFCWSKYWEVPTDGDEGTMNTVCRFLANHPKVETVGLPGHIELPQWTKKEEFLPSLRYVETTNVGTLMTLIPGRPIEKLELGRLGGDEYAMLAGALSLSTHEVGEVRVTHETVLCRTIPAMAAVFSRVRRLELKIGSPYVPRLEILNKMFQVCDFPMLEMLTLHVVVLSGFREYLDAALCAGGLRTVKFCPSERLYTRSADEWQQLPL